MNLPNALTLLRILLTIVFLILMNQNFVYLKVIGLLCFFIASITDFLDGYIARRYNLITSFGKIMDPIADKFLTLSAFFIFFIEGLMPLWMLIIIFVRELGITLFRLVAARKGLVLAAEKLGKYKTVLQAVVIHIIIIYVLFKQMPSMCNKIACNASYWPQLIFWMLLIVVIWTVFSGIKVLINKLGGKDV